MPDNARSSALASRDKNFTDAYVEMFGYDVSVKTVTFIVTHKCNLRCSYCYEHHKGSGTMSLETAKRCVDVLFEEDARNSRYINDRDAHGIVLDFIGGEPLLEIELIDQTLDYFVEKAILLNHRWATHFYVSISTNGINHFEPRVQAFLNKWGTKVSYGVTVDGNKELHDSCRKFPDGRPSYDLSASAFRDCLQRYGYYGTKLTIAPANLPHLFEACKSMITEFPLRYLFANTVFEEGWNKEHAVLFYQQLKELADWTIENGIYKTVYQSLFDDFIGHPLDPDRDNENWCGGCGLMLAFDIDGKCYPCLRYSPLSIGSKQEPYVIGDAENGIDVLPEHSEKITYMNGITRCSQSSETCFFCPVASGCAWCSAYNYEVNGTPNSRVTYICGMHKARVLATCYFLNTVYRREGLSVRKELFEPWEMAKGIISREEYDMILKLSEVD